MRIEMGGKSVINQVELVDYRGSRISGMIPFRDAIAGKIPESYQPEDLKTAVAFLNAMERMLA